jgi:hypothetical protein
MAAVAAFNGRARDVQTAPSSPTKHHDLDPLAVEAEFETVLVSIITSTVYVPS